MISAHFGVLPARQITVCPIVCIHFEESVHIYYSIIIDAATDISVTKQLGVYSHHQVELIEQMYALVLSSNGKHSGPKKQRYMTR